MPIVGTMPSARRCRLDREHKAYLVAVGTDFDVHCDHEDTEGDAQGSCHVHQLRITRVSLRRVYAACGVVSQRPRRLLEAVAGW
jgi:hypothetical protein